MKINHIFLLLVTLCMGNILAAKTTDSVKQTIKVAEVVHLTKAEFLEKVFNYEKNAAEWKYEGNMPCIIDFYATWCGPCRIIAPILDELAKEYAGKIVVYKIDTDKEKELSASLGISGLPTVLFCPLKGTPAGQMGAQSKSFYKQAIDNFLLADPQKTAETTTGQIKQ